MRLSVYLHIEIYYIYIICNFAVMQSTSTLKTEKQNKILPFDLEHLSTLFSFDMLEVTWTWESHSTSSNSTFLIWKTNIIKPVHLLVLVSNHQSISDKHVGIMVKHNVSFHQYLLMWHYLQQSYIFWCLLLLLGEWIKFSFVTCWNIVQ